MSLVNLCPNGSFEHDTAGSAPAGWTTTATRGFVVEAATFTGSVGSQVSQLGAGLTQTGQATQTTGSAVTAGTSYEAVAAYQQITSAGGGLTIGIAWYDSSNTLISTSTGAAASSGATGSTGTISVTATAPTGAVTAKLVVTKGFDTHEFYVDAINFAPASQGTTYHDGDTSGWSWSGTVGNSISTAVDVIAATGSGSFSFNGSAVGVITFPATGAGSYTFSGTATGTSFLPATGAGSYTFAGTAAGTLTLPATGTGDFTYTGTAAGTIVYPATGAGSFTFTGTAAGSIGVLPATGTGTYTFTGTAAGTLKQPAASHRILVRDRPPLQLSMHVAIPNGPAYRWAGDERDTRNVPDALTFTTTMPGGFEQASCTLERDPRINWPDLQELSNVQIRGLGGSALAWEGRLEEYPSQGGQQASVQPQIYGYQSALQDNDSAAMVYIDQLLSKWGSPSVTRQLALATNNYQLASSSAANDPTSGLPALVQTVNGSWVSPYLPRAEAWYDAGPDCLIAKIIYAVQEGTGVGGTWVLRLGLSSDANATTTEYTSNLNTGSAASGTYTPATPYRFALAQMYYPSTPAGNQGANYSGYWTSLIVIGNHGLTVQGSAGNYGILASDIIAHAVSTWASGIQYTTGSQGTIQPSSFAIPEMVFAPTTVSNIIAQAIQYELLDWAVWEQTAGTTGPTLFVNARGTRGNTWVSRVGQCQLQNAGPQASNIYNGVIVQYTDVTGASQTVGPPGSGASTTNASLVDTDPTNPANIAGITRWGLVQMGSSTAIGALQAGQAFLQVQAQLNSSGQASLVGHVQDQHGAWWPSWMVRAGDNLIVQDAADNSPRRIVSTSYDDTTKANTVQLDQPPADMAAVLAQMSAQLTPLGLS